MDDNRKKIIVKEILYWKESRLLPEHYCDYLLALYTEGNQPQVTEKEKIKRASPKGYLLLLVIPIIAFLLYFTELSFDLQMALTAILLILGLIITYYFFKKGIHFQISLVISALVLLLLSVELMTHYFPKMPLALYVVLIAHCLLWLYVGKKLKLIYFLISGYLGLGVLVIFIFI